MSLGFWRDLRTWVPGRFVEWWVWLASCLIRWSSWDWQHCRPNCSFSMRGGIKTRGMRSSPSVLERKWASTAKNQKQLSRVSAPRHVGSGDGRLEIFNQARGWGFPEGVRFLELRTFFLEKRIFSRGEGGSFASKGVRLLHRDFKGGLSEHLEPPLLRACFNDASTMAQAATAYWVTETPQGFESRLIAAKSKVTGLRQHEHIRRLETVGAVLGVALASTTSTLSACAGHRVAKIGERSHFGQWNCVHTLENPSWFDWPGTVEVIP